MLRPIAAGLLVGLLSCVAHALTPLVRGQLGYGLSVFEGETPERFEVEILGQMEGAASTGTIYLARLSGASLAQTGVLQGMSGSPVYVEGELIGAVMATWAFAKESLCSIRPIAEMRALADGLDAGAHPGYRPGASKAMAVAASRSPADEDVAARLSGEAVPTSMGLSNLELQAQGFGAEIRADIEARLGVRVHTSSTQSGEMTPSSRSLEPGESVAVLLVDGAARLSSVGTVTLREGDEVLGFGHPLLGLGAVSLPMARARVVALMPSQEISFKIAEPTATVGAMLIDRRAGMLGKLGLTADTLPLHASIRDASGVVRVYEFELARLEQLLPDLAAWAARTALLDQAQLGDDAVLNLRTRVEFESGEALRTEAAVEGAQAGSSVGSEIALGLSLVLAQREAMPRMTGLWLEIERAPKPLRASIGQVLVRPERPRPGDELRIQVELREDRGESHWQELRLRVPAGESSSSLQLRIGDGESTFRDEIARTPTRWQDPGMATIREALERRAPASALVAVLYAPPRSVLVEGAELREWPASLRSLLVAGTGRAVVDPVAATAIARARSETPWRLRGQRIVELKLGDAPTLPPGAKP